MKTTALIIIALFFAASTAQAVDNMKAFPAAEEGAVRYVLQLPKQDNESAFKVELIVGKMVQIDAGNRYFFSGHIVEEIIKGWGFPRYIVSKLGPMAGTLMAIDSDSPKIARFITLGGDPYIIRYNSRLPIVVYAPEDAEVRYRIWRADKKVKVLKKG
jgi:ecotin